MAVSDAYVAEYALLHPASAVHAKSRWSCCIPDGIGDAIFLEAFHPQLAGIAMAAGVALFIGVITAGRQRIIDAEPQSFADDLRLAQLDERRVEGDTLIAFDAVGCGEVGHILKCPDE